MEEGDLAWGEVVGVESAGVGKSGARDYPMVTRRLAHRQRECSEMVADILLTSAWKTKSCCKEVQISSLSTKRSNEILLTWPSC